MGFIYLITNKLNGRQYVGQTTRTIEERWKEHLDEADYAKKHNENPDDYKDSKRPVYLYNSMALHSVENFTIEQLLELPDGDLDKHEIELIAQKKYISSKRL
ncbi:GIY-YIG catalytic domain-containing protein [Faustovirus]|nr:GIY-YIG catalytic domain-containing protein [Faustovirus]